MSGSAAEREIRGAVVARLRELMPKARIIHELNVSTGKNRIDVAAIEPARLVAVEIKSERDKLTRLQAQWDAFSACSHETIVVAHRKHWTVYLESGHRQGLPPLLRLDHPLSASYRARNSMWCYPQPSDSEIDKSCLQPGWTLADNARWHMVQYEPRAASFLDLLWASELRAECKRHGIDVTRRSTRPKMIHDMAWLMTGKEIAYAVCRQLRARPFAEGDDPILEGAA